MNVYSFVSQCTVKSPFTSFFASSRLFLYPISHVLQIGLFHAKTSHDFLALGSFEVWQIFCSTESLLENKQSTRVACDTPNWVKRFRMRCVIANIYSEDLPNSFKSLGHRKSIFLFFFIFPENCIVLLRNCTYSGIPIPRTYRTALNLLVTGKVLFFFSPRELRRIVA